MNTKSAVALGATLLCCSFLVTSQVTASEEYDVRAFGPKSPIVWEKPTKVVFEHRTHTEELGLACSDCHSGLFAMQRGVAGRSGKLTMASLADGNYCGACHDGETAFSVDTNCTACHMVPEDPMVWTKPVKAVVFYHKVHIEEYGLECNSCHDSAFAMKKGAAENSGNFTMEALYEGRYCGQCHDGDTAFASNTLCNNCHIGVNGYKRMTGDTGHGHNEEHDGH